MWHFQGLLLKIMQKIIVKHFRQITFAEVEIKKILFLIGEQGSGKSTLAKLIYFFKSLKEDFSTIIYNYKNFAEDRKEEAGDIWMNIFLAEIPKKFEQYFGSITEMQDDFEVLFYYRFVEANSVENRWLRIYKSAGKYNIAATFGNYLREMTQTLQSLTEVLYQQKGSSASDYKMLEKGKKRFIDELINGLFYEDYNTSMFFPSGRNITVSYPKQFQGFFSGNLYSSHNQSVDIELMKSFMLHTDFLYDYYSGSNFDSKISHNSTNPISAPILAFFRQHAAYILQGKYENIGGNEKISYANNQSISLNIASSGQQEAIRIIQDLFYLLLENQKSFRVIEEPEAHLYPKAQKMLIELIALIVNKTESQIIITTHSPYTLSILNNLLMYSIVCQNKPNATDNIAEHFGATELDAANNEKINLLRSQVQAYTLSIHDENYCTSIIDAETGLIGENYLDANTEELNNDFNVLYTLNFQN